MAKRFRFDDFNALLKNSGQQLQAIKVTGTIIKLSNGICLTDEKEIRLCKRRTMGGHPIWRENFDRIYGLDIADGLRAEKEARSITSKLGGINCQIKHGDKIRQNLKPGITKGKKSRVSAWNKGLTKNNNKSLASISEQRTGSGNPMYGIKHSSQYKQDQSHKMKRMILDGTFTPNSNNRNTHWASCYKNKKFRSSWEALYQAIDLTAEYETLRIAYDYKGKNYVYIVDFVNHNSKIAIEVKPIELTKDDKTHAKLDALKRWCKSYQYEFLLCDQYYLLEHKIDDLSGFDLKTKQKIEKLYETYKENKNSIT